ncbi:hypothetical protein [Paenibacillus glucanolyticus]|uniref:hypothetical protein n=2 Tax=Paenibacillus glucanolyticus TaxID=59843 RepID=UPI001D1590E5|nr:hypothetical protein [Paenibacillus glucanolyticus]
MIITREKALSTPQSMRHTVRRALRSSLLELGSGTKAELSDKLGISFPTVGKVLEQMKQEGEVTLLGLDESSGGRRANRYAFNPDYMLGLAVYYEKEQSVYTLFNWNGDLIERTVKTPYSIADRRLLHPAGKLDPELPENPFDCRWLAGRRS